MDVGMMKNKVSFYTTSSTQDSGGLTQTRTLLFSRWCNIEQLNQSRALQFGITENYRTHQITVRYNSQITPKQTVDATINGTSKTLTIQSVLNSKNDHRDMVLICTEND